MLNKESSLSSKLKNAEFLDFLNLILYNMAQTVKESACNLGDLGSILGLGASPGGGHVNPLQYSCLENPHGQRSLAGYNPWGHNKSDMTEHLGTQ